MPYITCRTVKEFIDGLTLLTKERGPCLLDDLPTENHVGFQRGTTVVRLPMRVYRNNAFHLEYELGRFSNRGTRQTIAKMIEHGHLPMRARHCVDCVASDPMLSRLLELDVLGS